MVTVKQAKDTLAAQVAKYAALGFVEVNAPGAAPEAVKPFEGVSAKALKTLIGKLSKVEDESDVEEALEKATSEEKYAALAFHVLPSVAEPGVRALLAYLATFEEPIDAQKAERLASFLQRRLEPTKHASDEWFSGWPRSLDTLVYRAIASFPDSFAKREAHFRPVCKAGLSFVRGRRNQSLTTTERRDVLRRLAAAQATDYGIYAGELPFLDAAGREGIAVIAESDPRGLVERYGSETEWAQALAIEAPFNRWYRVRYVGPAISVMPLDALVAMIVSRPSDPFGYEPNAETSAFELLSSRADPPQSLLDATQDVSASVYHSVIREVFAFAAGRAWLARGEPIPAVFDERIGDFSLMTSDAVDIALDVLRQLPRERVLRLVRDRIEHTTNALGALGAHYDGEIFEAFLASNRYDSGSLLALVGEPGLSALARSLDSCPEELIAPRREGLIRAMKRVLKSGANLASEWDEELAKPLHASDDLRIEVIAALPPERRDRIIGKSHAHNREFGFDVLSLTTNAAVIGDYVRRALEAGMVPSRLSVSKWRDKLQEPMVRHLGLCLGNATAMAALEEALPAEAFKKARAAAQGKR